MKSLTDPTASLCGLKVLGAQGLCCGFSIREELELLWRESQREEGLGCLWNTGEAALNFSFTAKLPEMPTGMRRDAEHTSWDSSRFQSRLQASVPIRGCCWVSRIFQSRVCEAGTGLSSLPRGDGECHNGEQTPAVLPLHPPAAF